ncbi:anti-sigma factor [soil metagenome]
MTAPQRLSCAEVEELAGLFMLDALSPEAAAAVAAHLGDCPEAHQSMTLLAPLLSMLAASVEPRPVPPGLRERVLAAVASTPQLSDAAGAPTRVAATRPMPEPAGRSIAAPHREPAHGPTAEPSPVPWSTPPPARRWAIPGSSGQRAIRWTSAAAFVLVIVVMGLGSLTALQRESVTADRLALLRSAIAVAADPTGNVARLQGSGAAEGATGFAVFPEAGSGFIVIDGLAQAPQGSGYQAWFIGDGAPVSVGLVDVTSDGLATLTGLEPVSGTHTIALSVETLPGADAPTSTPIVAGELVRPLAILGR